MSRTLVIILSETRANELTFENNKSNLIDVLDADLCLCIGIKPDYDYENPFYKLAKYKFLYNEPDDFGDAFEYAYNTIVKDENIDTTKNHLYWREFLKVKNQFMGGVKDKTEEHPGSAGILIFFRWFLLRNLLSNDLLSKYERFVITRSDYIYTLPHPKLSLLDSEYIWIPNEEYYGGYTDRHVILSPSNIAQYLGIFHSFVLKSVEYFEKMIKHNEWNLEKVIKFHLQECDALKMVREIPYVMYSVRPVNGSTRWSSGVFSKSHNYFIKYPSEYNKSNNYKNLFLRQRTDIDTFYKNRINEINEKY
jgi:hypothetical protein